MALDYRQLRELRDALARHGVAYLVIGKGGSLLHGFPDTTQDTDIFVRKTAAGAWSRGGGGEIDGIPVCALDDIIESKRAANRPRDRESLPRLEAFREYQRERLVRRQRLRSRPQRVVGECLLQSVSRPNVDSVTGLEGPLATVDQDTPRDIR